MGNGKVGADGKEGCERIKGENRRVKLLYYHSMYAYRVDQFL